MLVEYIEHRQIEEQKKEQPAPVIIEGKEE